MPEWARAPDLQLPVQPFQTQGRLPAPPSPPLSCWVKPSCVQARGLSPAPPQPLQGLLPRCRFQAIRWNRAHEGSGRTGPARTKGKREVPGRGSPAEAEGEHQAGGSQRACPSLSPAGASPRIMQMAPGALTEGPLLCSSRTQPTTPVLNPPAHSFWSCSPAPRRASRGLSVAREEEW